MVAGGTLRQELRPFEIDLRGKRSGEGRELPHRSGLSTERSACFGSVSERPDGSPTYSVRHNAALMPDALAHLAAAHAPLAIHATVTDTFALTPPAAAIT